MKKPIGYNICQPNGLFILYEEYDPDLNMIEEYEGWFCGQVIPVYDDEDIGNHAPNFVKGAR